MSPSSFQVSLKCEGEFRSRYGPQLLEIEQFYCVQQYLGSESGGLYTHSPL